VRFDAARQAVFLAHFGRTCDRVAAAAAAGVSPSTVDLHCRNDPVFAEAYREELARGYVTLEAEAVRLRLESSAKLRAAVEAFAQAGVALPAGLDPGAEFDRTMKLLARWDRKPRRPEGRFAPDGRRQQWTFEQAIAALDKRLRALGLRKTPPMGGDEDGNDEDSS
jgi:hypothetical protein